MDSLRETPPLTPREAVLLSPVKLAYLGDTIWDLLVRSRLLARGLNVRHMHRDASLRVNAGAQAEAFHRIEAALTPQEADVARRGRNTQIKHPVPKHQEAVDYQCATGLEALMGYLYITGAEERLRELFALSQEQEGDHAPV